MQGLGIGAIAATLVFCLANPGWLGVQNTGDSVRAAAACIVLMLMLVAVSVLQLTTHIKDIGEGSSYTHRSYLIPTLEALKRWLDRENRD